VPASNKEDEMFRVSDWDRKLKYYNNPKKLEMMKRAIKEMDNLWELYDSSAWK